MKEESDQTPEPSSPMPDELMMEVALELADELLMRAGTILGDKDGVLGDKEEKQISELLKEFNERGNELLAQKQQEKVKRQSKF